MATPCPHAQIEASLDRWSECHWHLHQMETYFHEPELFRFSLNSFIRSAKEVPGILLADVQRYAQVRQAIDVPFNDLMHNELFIALKKRRDFLVHRGTLELKSHGNVRAMEGHRVKMSLPFPVPPYERSDDAYERYKALCRADKVWRSLSGPDCDSTPAIWRTWMIPEFPNRELLEVAFDAWTLVGKVLSAAVVAFEGAPLDLSMPCRHNPQEIQLKRYSQQEFFLSVDGIDLEAEERKHRALRAAAQSGQGSGESKVSED